MLDTILRGGTVIDGTGAASVRADVGIQGDSIAVIGDLGELDATEIIDATGRIVAPGFIDIHSHSDFTLLVDPRAQSAVAQGVTTEIVGNCGHGCAPIGNPAMVTGNIYGYSTDVDLTWRTVGEYLERLESARAAVNVATLVPNGNLRLATIGLDQRASDADERTAMANLLRSGLEEGALGFSSGLEYPSEQSTTEAELIELCRITAQYGGLYATHTRNRDSDPLPAIDEAVRTARCGGCPLQISHIIPRRSTETTHWLAAVERVDAARADGLDVTFDSHTRLVGTTNLSTVLPPDLLRTVGDPLRDRLRDPEVRQRIRAYPSIIASWGETGWEHVYLFSSREAPDLVGRSFADPASAGDGLEAVLRVLMADADDPHYPLAYCYSYEEPWLRGTMRHPHCMIGSDATTLAIDGPLAESSFLGAYTWVGWFLRTLVREHRELSWEEGIRKLTSLPADRLGLRRRGRLAPGYLADVVVFDPLQFRDRGTDLVPAGRLDAPNQLAVGMDQVLVNGVVTLRNGVRTGVHGGRVLRRAS